MHVLKEQGCSIRTRAVQNVLTGRCCVFMMNDTKLIPAHENRKYTSTRFNEDALYV